MTSPIKQYFIPEYARGTTIIIRDHSYSLSLENKEGEGKLYVDRCIFYATGLPLHQHVRWRIKDEYLKFFKI